MPLSDEDVVAAFGDPRPYLKGDGGISPFWETRILTLIHLPSPLPLSWDPAHPVTLIRCHRLVAPLMSAAFEEVYNHPEAWRALDSFGGCYNWRAQRGSVRKLSRHSWGIAVDLDVKDNPQGAPGHMHPDTIAAFALHGFEWGGAWQGRRQDPMHFEFADLKRLAEVV